VTTRALGGLGLLGAALFGACEGGNVDAGGNLHGALPVDERNPVILANDSALDNWSGEYAMLLANSGGPPLAGFIVNASLYSPDLATNVAGWNQMIEAARSSGLRNIPDATASVSQPLVRPADGDIRATPANNSAGAHLILELSARVSLPWRPLVVVTGSRLTDVADAYLIDSTVADRVVVVSSLGGASRGGSVMGWPNGELDPWADWIVSQRFRYIQVNGYYDQLADVTTTKTANLPSNPFGTWMAGKAPGIFVTDMASDQIGVLVLGVPTFATTVGRAVAGTGGDPKQPPQLVPQADGGAWIVSTCDGPMASEQLWKMLMDPKIFGHH
jgi:hypothetical protein